MPYFPPAVVPDLGSFLYGDGSDGAIVISGTTTETRDRNWTTLQVTNTGTYNTANFRIRARTSMDLDGITQVQGGAGTAGGAGGGAVAAGTLVGGFAGGAGGV